MPSAPRSSPTPDPTRCPLCGQSNRCAIKAGQPAADCWCMSTLVAPAALAAVPADLQVQACLCPCCAAGGAPAARRGIGAG